MKQAEKVYLISDAAKQVQVETHVLRYWEEELKLPIKRNELGHRYYTGEDIERFRQIRDLKEKGLQLKAIRSLMLKEENQEELKRHVVMVSKGEFLPLQEESREAKSLRLQQLLQNMIEEAVRSNNREICDEIKESLLKELDYQFRVQEERDDEREMKRLDQQEAHYREIDALLRTRSGRRRLERNVKLSAESAEAEQKNSGTREEDREANRKETNREETNREGTNCKEANREETNRKEANCGEANREDTKEHKGKKNGIKRRRQKADTVKSDKSKQNSAEDNNTKNNNAENNNAENNSAGNNNAKENNAKENNVKEREHRFFFAKRKRSII